MPIRSTPRRGRRLTPRRLLSATVSALLVLCLTLIMLHPGVITHDVNLNDGGVWVTNGKLRLLAHLNYPSRVLDAGLRTATESFDVAQHGDTVFLSDSGAQAFHQVDVAHTVLFAPASSELAPTMVLGGERVGVVDQAKGLVWSIPATQYGSFSTETSDPLLTDLPGAQIAMGADGSLHAASLERHTLVSVPATGEAADAVTVPLPATWQTDATITVSALGDAGIVYNQDTSELLLSDGHVVSLGLDYGALQLPGPQTDHVYVSGTDGVSSVSLSGEVETLPAPLSGGQPVRPVWHNACVYAAWSGQGGFLRDCASRGDDLSMEVASLNDADSPVFRVNRDVIVLNDQYAGNIWLPEHDMVQVEDWEQINSDQQESEEETDKTAQSADEAERERSEQNTPPTANDDTFGVRPGRSAYLPVTANDTDPDNDVLTVEPLSQPDSGSVVAVQSGAALQATLPGDATGSTSFTYSLSDGQASDTATVTLTVHPFSVNGAPQPLRTSQAVLGAGGEVTTYLLSDWIDPDGDPIYLKSVEVPSTLDASWRADGTVRIRDLGQAQGVLELPVVVSDGTADGEGILRLDLRGGDNVPPVANNDHVVGSVDTPVQFFPLLNDTDANGDPIRLVSVGDSPNGMSAEADPSSGAIMLTGNAVGSYYLTYTITDGPSSVQGVIRFDVKEPSTSLLPAVQDDAVTLPDGGQAILAPLDNDDDPSGGVLTIQSVDVPPESPLVVALVDHHLLRITAPAGLTQISTFTYTVVNAAGAARGQVMVIPVEAQSSAEPPELEDDSLVVRVGDVGSVNVLNNDRSPADLPLTLSHELQHEIDPAIGQPFVSDKQVRFRAGNTAGSGTLVYTVTDTAGNVSSATVRVTVIERDDERNTAPHPNDLTGWVVAGQSTTIPVPLNGIDAEGDSVTLSAIAVQPSMGSVEIDGSSLRYTAANGAQGTDIFTYEVRDALGKTARARVRVGVAPNGQGNAKPLAVPDVVRVRPGVRVSVPVLANDVDPDGDPLSLVTELVSSPADEAQLDTRGDRVLFTAPNTEGTFTVQYGVTDGKSQPVVGALTVVVSADAPAKAPIARDDQVDEQTVRSQAAVTVPVLDNDEDPDGDIEDDVLSSTDAGVSVSGHNLVIEVRNDPRYVLYTVTDRDNLSASALVYVPGKESAYPTLLSDKLPIRVKAGESVRISLNDYIRASGNGDVKLTDASRVSAARGWDGSELVADEHTLNFGAAADFSGRTAVSVEVIGEDQSLNQLAASLALTIEVEAGENRPPVLNPTAIEVAAGEEAVSDDVSTWVTDPDDENPTNFTYSVSGVPAGLQVTLNGAKLQVSAEASLERGTTANFSLTVTDSGGLSDTKTVPVNIVASTKPLAQLATATVTADAGQSVSVDVSSYAVNPFPDTPLQVLDVQSDGLQVAQSGSTLTITPPADMHGMAVVTYRVEDATHDVARQVQGRVEVTVRARPDAPIMRQVVSNSASTASVSWVAGAANGAQITGFTLYDDTQGDSIECGVVTTCLMSGRTNGIEHSFHVTATNAVGVSDPSGKASTMIDVVPGVVPAPSATEGDRSVTVNWNTPQNEGSAIVEYTVVLSPGSITWKGLGNSATFNGLSNGTTYTAVVRARNAKGESEQWSAPSLGVTPYGVPGAPQGISIGQAQEIGDSSIQFTISWQQPADNGGRAIEGYQVNISGQPSVSLPANQLSYSPTVPMGGGRLSISVVAINDLARPAGHTSPAATGSFRPVGTPLAPVLREVSNTGDGATATLSATVVEGHGLSAAELFLQWRANNGSYQQLPASKVISGNGLINGKNTVEVRACAALETGTACGPAVSQSGVNLTGPVTVPDLRCSPASANRIACDWSGGDLGGYVDNGIVFYLTAGNLSIPSEGQGHEEIPAQEGETVHVCMTASAVMIRDSKFNGPTEKCTDVRMPTYKRLYGPVYEAKKVKPGEDPEEDDTRIINHITLDDWPPNETVHCTVSFNGAQYSAVVRADSSGNNPGFGTTWANGIRPEVRGNLSGQQFVCDGGTPAWPGH